MIFVSFHAAHITLPPAARAAVLKHILHENNETVGLHAAVVMPNHVHLLLTPLLDQHGYPFPLQKTMQRIKSVSAHTVNRLLGCNGPVWQEESFDSLVRSENAFAEKLQYIEENATRAGLVHASETYRWFWKKARPRVTERWSEPPSRARAPALPIYFSDNSTYSYPHSGISGTGRAVSPP